MCVPPLWSGVERVLWQEVVLEEACGQRAFLEKACGLGFCRLLASLWQAASPLGSEGAPVALGVCPWVLKSREMSQSAPSLVTHGTHTCLPQLSWHLGGGGGQGGGAGRDRRGSRWLTHCSSLSSVPPSLEDTGQCLIHFPPSLGWGLDELKNQQCDHWSSFLPSQGTKNQNQAGRHQGSGEVGTARLCCHPPFLV